MWSELHRVGHARERAALLSALEGGRLPPALLLTGVEGIGKRALAEWLVAAAWCGAAPRPCLACRSCRAVGGGNHPDLALVCRETAPDDATTTTLTVGRIRSEVIELLRLRPMQAPGRMVLIDRADELNEEAQNALLHTLEEPPAGSHLVLVTARPERLLDTLLSRCQELRLHPLGAEEMHKLAGQEDQALLCLAQGRPGRLEALRSLDVVALLQAFDDRLCGRCTGALFARQAGRIAAGTEGAGSAHQGPRLALELLHQRVRDLAAGAARAGGTADLLPAPSPAPSEQRLLAAAQALLEAAQDLDRNLPLGVIWTALGRALRTPGVGVSAGWTP